MKHIFYVHSHITYIVAMSVVKSLDLPADDVLFLYGRGFKTTDVPAIAVRALTAGQEALGRLPSCGHWTALLRYPRDIRPLDAVMDGFVGNDTFVAYLPLTKSFLTQLLASHAKCGSLNIIEEGMLTYVSGGRYVKRPRGDHSSNWVSRLKRIAKFPCHLNRSVCYRSELFREPERVFLLFPELVVGAQYPVERPGVLHVPAIAEGFVRSASALLVLDPIDGKGPLDMDTFTKLCTVMSPELRHRSGPGVVLVKFHPGQAAQDRGIIMTAMAKSGVEVMAVPDEVAAEAILLSAKGIKVFGLWSSLLFYAAQWGQESYSLLRLLEAVKPGVSDALPTIPPVFWGAVKTV